jgi:hypothetical protein
MSQWSQDEGYRYLRSLVVMATFRQGRDVAMPISAYYSRHIIGSEICEVCWSSNGRFFFLFCVILSPEPIVSCILHAVML